MVEYNTVNAKLSNLQLNKLKSAVKSKQGTTLRMNPKMFNGNNLLHELLLTTRQTTKLRNAIENNMSTDIELSKTQITEIIQSVGFLGKILGPLLKTGFPLLKSVIKPLGLLGLTAVSSAIDAGVQKKIYGSRTKTLVISNEETNDIMKIAQALEDSSVLLKGVTKTSKNETKEQKGEFLGMLLGTLGPSLLGDLLTKSLSGKRTIRAGEGFLRTGKGIKKETLMPGHPLTNFQIQEYYKNEPRFNDVYSRDNLPKTIKNGAYVINLDEYEVAGTNWIPLYVKDNEITYFDSFGVEHVPKEIKKLIEHKNIKTNIFRIQADNSIMCGYFCIGFIDFMFAGKSLFYFTSLFSPYDFKKNFSPVTLNELVFHILNVLGHDLHT